MASEGIMVLSLTRHAHAKTGTSTIHNHRRAALLGVRVPSTSTNGAKSHRAAVTVGGASTAFRRVV